MLFLTIFFPSKLSISEEIVTLNMASLSIHLVVLLLWSSFFGNLKMFLIFAVIRCEYALLFT